jgi:hypothetical protein
VWRSYDIVWFFVHVNALGKYMQVIPRTRLLHTCECLAVCELANFAEIQFGGPTKKEGLAFRHHPNLALSQLCLHGALANFVPMQQII